VIVRWGLDALPDVLAELGIERPLLVATDRWSSEPLPIHPAARWTEVPSTRIREAAAQAGDGVIALGGGSAIDLGKAISAASGVRVVSVPTTYAGAEWTTYFGVRDPERRMRGGDGRRHRARKVDARACACDGAGGWRALRGSARRRERDLPSAGARVQPPRCGGRDRSSRRGARRGRGRACPGAREARRLRTFA